MKFNNTLIEAELNEGLGKDIAKAAAGIGLVTMLLVGHAADIKTLNKAQQVIRTELSSEIKDLIPEWGGKAATQRAIKAWHQVVQDAIEENPELKDVPSLYRAGEAIIRNPSLLRRG